MYIIKKYMAVFVGILSQSEVSLTKRETSRYGGRGGGRGGRSMTDRQKVLWGMNNGPSGAGKPTQRQLRVKDDQKIFDKLFFS